jgi:UMF1 family MFS transporter
MKPVTNKKQVLSWALYDWANSAFATTVMAGFFPIFYKQYWAAGVDASSSTFQLGVANAAASLVIVLCAPVLGAIADAGKYKKAFLFCFALLGIVLTGLLYWVDKGDWAAAVMLFSAATVGFMGANVFYDALILNVSNAENRDVVSALGFALGYLGGGLLFAVNVAMTLSPESFGLLDASEAVRLSFISVSIWWAVFSIPLFLFVKEKPTSSRVSLLNSIGKGLRQFVATFHQIRALRNVWLFLLAYWLYIDGVDTVVRMAVDYGLSIGLESNHLIAALLLTQFVGFPAAIGFGYLGKHLGTRQGIYIALTIYVLVTGLAYFIDSVWEFYLLAGMIGLVQGGVQSLSRSFYADIIPASQPAEFFGFYNMMGKSAALLGPLLVGLIVLYSGDHRLGMLSLIVLFVAGGILLTKVEHHR